MRNATTILSQVGLSLMIATHSALFRRRFHIIPRIITHDSAALLMTPSSRDKHCSEVNVKLSTRFFYSAAVV